MGKKAVKGLKDAFVNRRYMYTKRVPFLPNMVYKRVTQWLDLWAELPCIKLCCGGAGIYNVHVQERHLKYILLSRWQNIVKKFYVEVTML